MAIPTMLQAPTRNLFDFWNAAIPNAKTQQVPLPTTNTKQSVNEQIMSRLLPQGTVTQQIRKATAPANIGKTQQQVNVSKPMYSNDTKLAIWKQHGGDESNFDTNDFNHTNTGAIYLKNDALTKIKPKETPSVLPTAKAQETKAQPMHLFSDEKEAYDKMLADGISEDEANQTIKERRVQLLPDNGLTANEKSALLKMQADGMTAKEATETLSLYRQKHQEAIDQAKAEAQNAWYGEKAVNALAGLALGAYQGAGNLLDTFTNLAASTYGGTGTDIGKQFEEAGQKYWQTMPWLEAGMEAGKTVYGMGADVATGGPKNAILAGAKSWAMQTATEKSGADIGDLATGAVIGWAVSGAVSGAGKVLGATPKLLVKIAPNATKKAAQNLQVSGVINPTDLKNVAERYAKLTWKEPEIKDTADWLLKRGIKWDIPTQRKMIQSEIEKSKGVASNLLKKDTNIYNTSEVKELQKALNEKAKNFGDYEWDVFVPSAGNTKKVQDIFSIANKDGLTLEEINKGRTLLGEDLFNKQGTLKELASKEGWQNVWKDASAFLENKAKGFREANKNTELGIALNNAMLKKEAGEQTRQLLSYLGLGGVAGGGTYAMTGDPSKGIEAMAIWFGAGQAKKMFNNPAVKSKIAQYLNSLSSESSKSLSEIISGTNIPSTRLTRLLWELKRLGIQKLVSPNNSTNQ